MCRRPGVADRKHEALSEVFLTIEDAEDDAMKFQTTTSTKHCPTMDQPIQ
jgi:hypothetical protein